LYSQLSLEQEIPFISGLKAKGTIAYDPTVIMNKIWSVPADKATIDKTQTPYVITQGPPSVKPSLSQAYNQRYQLTYQASLDYAKEFGNSHVTALALFEAKGNNTIDIAVSRRNYNLLIDEINMGSSTLSDMTTSGTSSDARQVGFLYRVTYDYAGKYLFEASGRYDGSYYFAPGKRFGFFPAFSVGWRLSEEGFLKDVSWLENLKIRASHGEVGRSPARHSSILAPTTLTALRTPSEVRPCKVSMNEMNTTRILPGSERSKETLVSSSPCGKGCSKWRWIIFMRKDPTCLWLRMLLCPQSTA
jgi:hypothetical protein